MTGVPTDDPLTLMLRVRNALSHIAVQLSDGPENLDDPGRFFDAAGDAVLSLQRLVARSVELGLRPPSAAVEATRASELLAAPAQHMYRTAELVVGKRPTVRVDPLDELDAVHLSSEEFGRLIAAGVLDGKVELLEGKVIFGRYAASFSAAQRRDAAQLGVDLRPGAGRRSVDLGVCDGT